MPILVNPIMVPAPRICPRLVVANNSGNPSPCNPAIGIDGPNPLIFIAYLPNPIQRRLHMIIISAICNDHL